MSELKEARVEYVVTPAILPDVSGWSLPPAFAWLARFDAGERMTFFQELLVALAAAGKSRRWQQVTDLIDAWQETAAERTDAALQQRLSAARRELVAGGGYSWEETRRELGM